MQIPAADVNRSHRRNRLAVRENANVTEIATETVIATAVETATETVIAAETEIVIVAETATMTAMAARAIMSHALNRVLTPDLLVIPAVDVTISNHRRYDCPFFLVDERERAMLN